MFSVDYLNNAKGLSCAMVALFLPVLSFFFLGLSFWAASILASKFSATDLVESSAQAWSPGLMGLGLVFSWSAFVRVDSTWVSISCAGVGKSSVPVTVLWGVGVGGRASSIGTSSWNSPVLGSTSIGLLSSVLVLFSFEGLA